MKTELRPRLRLVAAAAALVFLTACGELRDLPTDPGGGDPPDPTATFTRVQNEIFTPTCAVAGCHDATGQQQGMNLSAGAAYQNIVNQASTELPNLMRVKPGDHANSYLYRKVSGSPEIIGQRMPLGSPPLSQAQIDLIRDWIRRGAPND